MSRYFLLLVIACSLFLPACTTISRSSMDHFRVDTVPQGAKVTTTVETDMSEWRRQRQPKLKPEYYGCPETPCAIEMPRKSVFIATITHPGYEPAEIAVGYSGDSRQMTASMAGNTATSVAAGGAVGAAAGTAFIGMTSIAVIVPNAFSAVLGGPMISTPTSGVVAGATAGGLGIGLAFGVTSAVIDTGTGAYMNLYPNPIVIVLAKEGEPTVIDPNVAIVRQTLTEQDAKAEEKMSSFDRNRKAAEKRRKAARDK